MNPSTPSSTDQLFRAGIEAFRANDRPRARQLLSQVVRLDPHHEQAWLGLARVCSDPRERLYCLHQAGDLLSKNGRDNSHVQDAYRKIRARFPDLPEQSLPELASSRLITTPSPSAQSQDSSPVVPLADNTSPSKVLSAKKRYPRLQSIDQQRRRRIESKLSRATEQLEQGNDDAALKIYRDILEIDPTHSESLARAMRLLSRPGSIPEALSLAEEGVRAGNQDPTIHIWTAKLRLSLRTADPWSLLENLPTLPDIEAEHLLHAAQLYQQYGQMQKGLWMLHEAEKVDPSHQPTLLKLAETYKQLLQQERAQQYYQRVVDLGARTETGQAAEDFLLEVAPYVPRYIETHTLYALREVLGILIIFFLLATLDAGMTVIGMGTTRLLGILLSFVGGYFLVTGTSSPAQSILSWFHESQEKEQSPDKRGNDDFLPEMTGEDSLPSLPVAVRVTMSVIGAVVLTLAISLVLQTSFATTQMTASTLNRGEVPAFIIEIIERLFF